MPWWSHVRCSKCILLTFWGEQHADGGPDSPCVWLPDETGQTRCSSKWGGGEKKNVCFVFLHSWLILLSLLNMLKWRMKALLLWSWPMLPPSCRWTVWCCSCIASGSSWRRPAASGWTSCSSYCGTASCCRRASPPWPACCCWRSWNSEQEAGCWVARRTSTTTVKLQTRIVARTQVLDGRFADIRAPLVPSTLITKPATSSRKSSAHFFFPWRVQLINCKT